MFPHRRSPGIPARAAAVAVCLLLLFGSSVAAQERTVVGPDPDWDPEVLPGDLVALIVPREPDLNGGFTVNLDYLLTLPVLGELDVRGETQRSLRTRIRTGLARVVRDPGVDVIVQKRIRVLGSVGAPGVYNAEPTMSVADILALAGGRTPEGKQDELQLRRDGTVLVENISEARSVSDLRLRTGDELYVPERSWLSRNLTAVATSVFGAITVIAVTLAGN